MDRGCCGGPGADRRIPLRPRANPRSGAGEVHLRSARRTAVVSTPWSPRQEGRHARTGLSPLPWIVIYTVREDVIDIVRILHGAQRWP
ncbi:MAG: type II toxin-antitoxin system RelE/ParE family toxin [Acidobacteria bacterium]|nr:type II toxin-antitoxin system RelE/ParE family toxin [Acidobacteriota bacterium]